MGVPGLPSASGTGCADIFKRCTRWAGRIMHDRSWAKQFYVSSAWIRCRTAYAKSVGGLCERCLERGVYTPGTEVHHKIKLTPKNVRDPSVALNWDNLELLCKDCHMEEHNVSRRRWKVDDEGTLILLNEAPPV